MIGKTFSYIRANPSRFWLILGLFLGVWGAKLQVLHIYSVDIPFEDEWHADAMKLFKPWEEGTLRISDLFTPHNEHRILFTRLWDLGWYLLNGQWSPQLLMIANAALHSLLAVVWFLVLERSLSKTGKLAFLLITSVLIALPYSTATALAAFQSQFYFLLLFSTLGIWLMTAFPPFIPAWWGGMGLMICAFFSVSSGLLGFLTVAFGFVLKYLRDRQLKRSEWYAAGLLVGIFGVGYLLRTEVPNHEQLLATSAEAFLKSFSMALAWPQVNTVALSAIYYAPFLLLNSLYVLRRIPYTPTVVFLLSSGWWIIMNIGASAYLRGGAGEPPAVRYWDILLMGVILNAACLLYIPRINGRFSRDRAPAGPQSDKHTPRKPLKPQKEKRPATAYVSVGIVLLGTIWFFSTGYGLYQQGTLLYSRMLPAKLQQQTFATQHIKDFLSTKNREHLTGKGVKQTSFSGNPDEFAALLSDPTVQKLLPPEINPISALKTWLTRLGLSCMAMGLPIMLVGLLCIGIGTLKSDTRKLTSIDKGKS